MAADEGQDAIWRVYDVSFREDAHQLLAWGYLDARHLIAPDLEEEDITGFIAEAIQAKLSSADIDVRFDRYNLKDDNRVPGEGRTGKHRLKMDIIIESSSRPRHKPRPQYIFEAKRLCRPNQTLGDYLGSEGILRFLQGRYAADCPEVAMVGYVQTDTISFWALELAKRFDKDSANQFCIAEKLSPISIVSHLTDEWVSSHQRQNGLPVTIFHIFFDCSA